MREVGIVSFAQSPSVRRERDRNEVELLLPVISAALEQAGVEKPDIDFVCSGSSDYLLGLPFSFVSALDAYGAWPPINESHVEMDGAWAFYEAWVKIQTGEVDTALVYAFGKSSLSDLRHVLSLQQDPYTVAPLWPDSVSLAALQARAWLEASGYTEKDMAAVAVRDRRNALSNPNAQLRVETTVDDILAEEYLVSPLRRSDCPPVSDGAACVVLAAGDRARELCEHPAWVRGIDHRIEAHQLGLRDLTTSVSTRVAAEKSGAARGGFDVAELHGPFTHQVLILQEALGLDESRTSIDPSGGALAANPLMVAGLARIGEAASRVMDGTAGRALAHATSGACLQQNLVCVLEGSQ